MTTQATPAPAHPARLSQLDGLRGLAAFVIMLYHLDIVYRIRGPFSRGYLFVDLFFLLSGFVLAVSTEKKLNAGINPFAFVKSRFVRLWPLVAVGAGVAAARAFAIQLADPLTLLAWLALDLAMIPSFAGAGPFYRFNGPQWTLFYELAANFFHALVLRKVPTRWVLALAAVLAGWLAYTVRLQGADVMGVNAPTWSTWWWALPRVGWSYVLGVGIGRIHRERGLPGATLTWWLALALPVAGIMALPSLPLGRVAGDLAFVVLFLPVTLWAAVLCSPPQEIRPALEWFGNYSLPLYCVHLTVLVWVSELLGRAAWVWPLAVATALVLAWAFSRLVSFAARPTRAPA
ncbi:MAG: acyltransferase [Sphingomonadales bacterium]|nr:acyltransferase [Sphingomonadales bacterium]MDE2570413.1 acyltransferase [Sphingomonadales bacterium]